jgi:hypothetical protein
VRFLRTFAEKEAGSIRTAGLPRGLKMVILNLLRILEELGMIIALKRHGLSRIHRAI